MTIEIADGRGGVVPLNWRSGFGIEGCFFGRSGKWFAGIFLAEGDALVDRHVIDALFLAARPLYGEGLNLRPRPQENG